MSEECCRQKETLRIVSLIVTHRCNFNCRYCYVKNRTMPDMTLETAKEAVKEAFSESSGTFDSLEIDFLGGEPLLQFEMIQELAEWIWAQDWPMPYVLFATTNGSLMDESKKRWFSENREKFCLCLSYDGETQGQEENRSRTELDVDFFLRTWPEQTLQMTLTEQSVGTLAENVIGIVRRGGRCRINCAYGDSPWRSESWKSYGRELGKLAAFYGQHPELPLPNVLDRDLVRTMLSMQKVQERDVETMSRRLCGIGQSYYVVETNGERYPCQLAAPLAMETGRMQEIEKWDLWSRTDFEMAGCGNCLLTGSCPVCYASALRDYGTPLVRETNHCHAYCLELLANCKYRAILLGQKKELTDGDVWTARAITYIHDYLQGG